MVYDTGRKAIATTNQIDPFPIYKAGEEPCRVYGVDFPAWQLKGWSKDPIAVAIVELPSTIRENELKAILAEPNGWNKIAAIAKPYGIKKPDGGWDEAIALIIAAES